MPAHNEASNIQAGRSRHNPFRTSTQNTGLRCFPVLRINLNCFPSVGAKGIRLRHCSIGMQNVVASGDIVKLLWFDGDGLCLFAN